MLSKVSTYVVKSRGGFYVVTHTTNVHVRNVPLGLRWKGLWLQLVCCAPYTSMSQDLDNGANLQR